MAAHRFPVLRSALALLVWGGVFFAPPGASAQLVWEAGQPEIGIHLVPWTNEGTVRPQGHLGRPSIDVDASKETQYAYFDVTDPAYRYRGHLGLWVRVDVSGPSNHDLVFQYDSTVPGHDPGDFAPLWLGPSRPGWTTYEFLVTDAEFAGGTNGHDFRIAWPQGATATVGRIEILPAVLPAAVAPHPRLVPQPVAAWETTVATLDGADLGLAPGTAADSSAALQFGLDQVARDGGGVLFLDTGTYNLDHRLRIPAGVTLQGRQVPPGTGPVQGATVLAITHGSNQPDGDEAVSVFASGTLRDLTFWYPDQKASSITPYPYTIVQAGQDGMTLERIRLVNSYRGIRIGPQNSELHVLKDVSGSPLETGLEIDQVTDVGRLEGLDFQPAYWSSSGLPGAPPAGGAHAAFMRSRGTGVRIYRSDWQYGAWSSIQGYSIGLHLAIAPGGHEGDGQFFGWSVTDCARALWVQGCSNPGWAFTRCRFEGSTAALLVSTGFTKTLLLESSDFVGPVTLNGLGRSMTSLLRCGLSGSVVLVTGCASVTAPWLDRGTTVSVGPSVTAVQWLGDLPPTAVFPRGNRLIPPPGPVPAGLGPGPVLPPRPQPFFRPIKKLSVVRATGKDDGPTIQKLLDKAGPGGLVYLAAGTFLIKTPLRIPDKVELRGSFAGPHHTQAPGTRLEIATGRNSSGGPPAVTLMTGSILRGVTLAYPEQSQAGGISPYPATLQGRGSDLQVINVTAVNPWDLLDLASFPCHWHYVDGLAGAPLRWGIRLGAGSRGGVILNTQFNPHYWGRDWASQGTYPTDGLIRFCQTQLEAFTLGDAVAHRFLQNFALGSRVGLGLEGTRTAGYHGAIWGLGLDVDRTSLETRGQGTDPVTLVNSQFVSLDFESLPSPPGSAPYLGGRPGSTLDLRLVATQFWGSPSEGASWSSGTLSLEGAVFSPGAPLELLGGALVGTNVFWEGTLLDRDLDARGGNASFFAGLSEQGLRVLPRGALPAARQGILALVPPIDPGALSLEVLLAKTQAPAGLSLVQANVETDLQPVEVDGDWAWQSEKALTPEANLWYVYARVDAADWRGPDLGSVTLEITYWDQPGLGLRLVYDGTKAPWTEAGRTATTGTRKWKTWKVKLPSPWFQGRLNGSDLRLEVVGKTSLPITRWALTRPQG